MNARIDVPEGTQKERIMALLITRANGERENRQTTDGTAPPILHRGWANIDVNGISKELGISPHDVTHALYDLRNRGEVQFVESRRPNSKSRSAVARGSTPSNGSSIPVRIRVPLPVLERRTKEMKTEQTAERTVAKTLHARLPFDLMPAADRPEAEARWAVRQAERDVIDVAAQIGAEGLVRTLRGLPDRMASVMPEPPVPPTPEPPEPTPEPEPEPKAVVATEADIVPAKRRVRARPSLAEYPLVAELTERLARGAKARQAVDLLLEAGMEEQALLIDSDVPTLSPLEKEVVRLTGDLRARGLLTA